jgi:hypothetical protein
MTLPDFGRTAYRLTMAAASEAVEFAMGKRPRAWFQQEQHFISMFHCSPGGSDHRSCSCRG